ncbi:DUF2326 domain-containing protein [Thalassospira permensis]|uniref:DUF2326 domain-containing protein n=1 Tax=Thalassospira permensis NBRC 106175 TaxID=1353532 RepID=A0ABR4TM63_9PROT|nr:DUF2326 domain-containing protein [Thalassospira permensis]KEO55738.1 hypothetical protein SMB34_04825 [Thalassospira permensis NBRC 106175]
MIIKLSSSLSTFKTLEFNPGLNILLAERHESSGVRGTRNGTGKTSFIELLHFLVAEKRNKEDDFHNPSLINNKFEVIFDNSGSQLTIEKTAGEASDHLLVNGREVAAIDLRSELSQTWFGLNSEITSQKYSPKFGALLSYFIRKERNGGFADPVLNSTSQKPWDSQVCLSYLLGFDWHLPQKLQLKKDEKKNADALSSMIKSGYLTDGELDLKKMQARADLLDSEIQVKRREVTSATVIDGYRSHEISANELTAKIRDMNEANLEDMDLCEDIELALVEVEDSDISDVRSLYEQVGIFFPNQVQKRFEQVEQFHRQVSKNRQTHLKKELENARNRIELRRSEIARLQLSLSEKLALLRSGVAIERLSLLQSELNFLEVEHADLQQQIPKFQNVAKDQKRLKREIDDLVDLIEQDVMERSAPRKAAVQIFAETSQALYDDAGQLIIGRSRGIAGLSIETDIAGKKSGGKNHMQVFCFDWLLVEMAKKNDRFPGFLVHDSHIFDGVDARQIALALRLAHQKCEELGVQYIVAMNSDDLQKVEAELDADFSDDFDLDDFILKTRLSDQPGGGLFGVQF